MCDEECNSVEEHIQGYVDYGLYQLPWKDMDELKREATKEHKEICEKLNRGESLWENHPDWLSGEKS